MGYAVIITDEFDHHRLYVKIGVDNFVLGAEIKLKQGFHVGLISL